MSSVPRQDASTPSETAGGSRWLDALWRFARSTKLAAWLIAVLALMTVLNVVVPQRTYLDAATMLEFERSQPALARLLEAVGLDAVFGGWMIAVVSALLAVNLTACTVHRFLRWRRPATAPRGLDGMLVSATKEPAAESLADAAASALASRGWRVLAAEGERRLLARGRHGFWGSMLLHVALLVLIVGGALSALTSFSGEVLLAEGQSIIDEPTSYIIVDREPALGDPYTGAEVRLDDIEVRYERGEVVSVVASMSAVTAEGDVIEKAVRVNHPLDVEGSSFLLLDTGAAPLVRIEYPDGRIERAVLNLGRRTATGWSDDFVLDGEEPVPVSLTVTPAPDDEPTDEPLTLPDPRLAIATAPGAVEGVLAEGESAELPGGVRLTFEDTLLWNRYMVRRAPARWVVYTGFWLAIAGAAWRFLFPERRLALVADAVSGGVRFVLAAKPWGAGDSQREAVRGILEEALSRDGARAEDTAGTSAGGEG